MQRIKILWNKVKIKLVSAIVNVFAFQTNYDIQNTVLITGTTRSGTTFLMESLNLKNRYRLIFEPFNSTYSKEWKNFSPRHYIDPDNASSEEIEVVDNILTGKIKNQWIDQFNRKIKSKQRIVKAVRANLLIDFLEKQYPELRILHIFRLPDQVVASRINMNFDPKDVFSILEHKTFIEKYYSDIDLSVLNNLLETREGCHAALWCLENRYLINGETKRKLQILQLENIVDKSITLIKDVIIKANYQRKPSVTSTLRGSYELSQKEFENVNRVLALFGLNKYIKKMNN